MSESLKDKTVKGVGWSAIDNVSQYAVQFVVIGEMNIYVANDI